MKRLLFILLAFPFFSTVIIAQPIEKAQKRMRVYDYSHAVQILKKAVDNPRYHDQALPLLAECYRMQNDNYCEMIAYEKAIALPGAKPEWFYYYGQSLRTAGEYGKAKDIFLKYSSLNPGDERGAFYAACCDSVLGDWKNKVPHYEIRNAQSLNSPQCDFGPAFYNGSLVFSSDRKVSIDEYDKDIYGWTGRGYLDILSSQPVASGDFWGEMKIPSSFNGKFNQTYHDGPAFFLNDKTVYFTRAYHDKTKKVDDLKTNRLKIFYSVLAEGKWGELQPFPFNSPDYSVAHPGLSADGSMICFTSDMPGGYGGTDIWVCKKEGDQWGKPFNPGKNINTAGNESFPSIQSDGSLIYASDRLPGYGGLDLFSAKYTDGGWSNPVNLGKPLNSSYDDFAMNYAPGSKTGFFSSNRPGGAGSDDIYAFKKLEIKEPEPVKPVEIPKPEPAFITGVVKDKTTLAPIGDATVFIFNPKSGKVVVLKTDKDGKYSKEAGEAGDLYVKAMSPNYIADCTPFALPELKPGTTTRAPRVLLLDKLEVNKTFRIDNIYYDFNKFNIRDDAKPELDKLVRIMTENNIMVELGSHTDCRGSFAYNDKLSQNRAQSAVDYIVSRGISPSRIKAKGYGEHQLINRCSDGVKCSDEEHQANRRTEFKVTGFVAPVRETDQFDLSGFKSGDEIDVKSIPLGFFGSCK